MGVDLKQLGQSSATDGQVVTFDAASGIYTAQAPGEGTSSAQEREKRLFLYELSAYPSKGKASSASDIQYTQLWILKDTELSTMESFLVQGGGSGDNLRMGIYDQASPTDLNGIPVNRVAQTNVRVLIGGDDGTYVQEALTANYTIPTTGYYWLACIVNGLTAQWASSPAFRADFAPRREEAGTGAVLPATVGTISNPTSSIVYCAGIRV